MSDHVITTREQDFERKIEVRWGRSHGASSPPKFRFQALFLLRVTFRCSSGSQDTHNQGGITVKIILINFLLLMAMAGTAQRQVTEVMTLGTFHFAFPNKDVRNIEKENQIDVLEPKYQEEVQDIVQRLARFKPTIIAIEREPGKQSRYDSLLGEYLAGKYSLRRNEEEQIGFRLAKLLGLKKLYCVDSWNRFYEDANFILEQKDSAAYKKFLAYLYESPDKSLEFVPENILRSKGIRAQLKLYNDEESIRKSLGNYLIGIFKYETKDNVYFGPDFVTGWGFNRNLKIFRNIQEIGAKPTDRILVIYGYGHLCFLSSFFESSPEFKLVKLKTVLE